MAIKRRKQKNTRLGGPWWAKSNDLHVRFSAAFCPGEQLLCGWLPQQGWQGVGAAFFFAFHWLYTPRRCMK